MSEIQGFGPTQPLRSAPASRPAAPRADENVYFGTGLFGDDQVYVSGGKGSDEILPSSVEPAAEPVAQAAPSAPPRAEAPVVSEIDGFILAGQSASSAAPRAEVGQAFTAGPIAVIDEPGPAGAEFPDLGLNGPSTAFEGLFGLGGARIA